MSSACSSPTSVSVIIPTHNEAEQLRSTVESLLAGLPRDGEIIIVDDVSTDGSAAALERGYGGVSVIRSEERLGVSGARTAGLQAATGAVVVFSDAHVRAPGYWAEAICEALEEPHAGAVAPCIADLTNHQSRGFGLSWRDPALNVNWLGEPQGTTPVPLVCGCFFAMKREVFQAVGGFDEGLTTWGYEDAELSLRLWLLGYECLVTPMVEVFHMFRPAHPYAVSWETIYHNILRLAVSHFNIARLERVVGAMAASSAYPAAFARLVDGDVFEQRSRYRASRVYDDDWFFRRFDIDW